MKKYLFYFTVLSTIFLASCKSDTDVPTATLNLDNKLPKADSTWVGDTSGKKIDENNYKNEFTDGFFVFNNNYNSNWKSWSGFAMTNASDTETGNHTNNSAITGKAAIGKVYLTANSSSYSPAIISFADGKAHKVQSMYVTNTTYAYKVIENGNQFSKKFGNGDWFKLDIFGEISEKVYTDTISVYLADFRDGKTSILKDWKKVDMSKWGAVKSIRFNMTSTDVGEYGMNTPSYFCVSGIKAEK